MALKLKEEVKGVEVDYWKIVDCDVKRGIVCIALFANQESAKIRSNMLNGRTSFKIEFDLTELEENGVNPISFSYAKIKESNMSTWKEASKDEEGNEVTVENFVAEELNKFALAEDC